MKLKLVTARLDPKTGCFPPDPLADLSGEVVSVVEHFFHHDGAPHLLLVVHYRPALTTPTTSAVKPKARDPRVGLSPDETARYDRLRAWRASRAEADGVPIYLLLSNRQLSEIARSLPADLAGLQKIKGIGAAKAKSFGQDVLTLLKATPDAG
ncbi:MAG: ATP-dependent DNA helicase RecQ [Myxococcota bacterium]|jgi:ATP-dependent DNA helicase RecQ